MPKFQETSCSQCGHTFGPGDSGYSHCDQHANDMSVEQIAEQTQGSDLYSPTVKRVMRDWTAGKFEPR